MLKAIMSVWLASALLAAGPLYAHAEELREESGVDSARVADPKITIISFKNGEETIGTVELPVGTKVSVVADTVLPDPSSEDRLRAKSNVKLSIRLPDGSVLMSTGSDVLLEKRPAAPELSGEQLALRGKLEAMLEADQSVRSDPLFMALDPESSQFKERYAQQLLLDQKNVTSLLEIVSTNGWPRQSVVGDTGSTAAFLVLQHSDLKLQKEYLSEIEALADTGEIKMEFLALLRDRILVSEGRPQIYGTQIYFNHLGAHASPIGDVERVDIRRAKVGLPPLAQYLAMMNEQAQPRMPQAKEKPD